MCATSISGHLQRVGRGASIVWVFLTRLEALWEVSQTRALRRQQQAQIRSSQAAAAAAVSAGERDQNLEQEDLDAQACVRECPRGSSRVQQAEEISSAVLQRRLCSERVLQDVQQQITELLETKE